MRDLITQPHSGCATTCMTESGITPHTSVHRSRAQHKSTIRITLTSTMDNELHAVLEDVNIWTIAG